MKHTKIRVRVLTAALLACTLLFGGGISAANEATARAQSWYVRRAADHRQPSADLADSTLADVNAYYVDRTHGDRAEEKVLYLTFDAGYENGNVAKILDTLKAEEVPAAFFILKHMITKETALVQRMAREGHLVCNHTMSHRDTTRLSEAELEGELNGLAALSREVAGVKMAPFYRPPEGKFSIDNLRQAAKMGYATVFWSLAYADWDNARQPAPEAAMKKLLDNTHNGAVILLHPTSATNAEILPALIKKWKSEGYRFASLYDLVASPYAGESQSR